MSYIKARGANALFVVFGRRFLTLGVSRSCLFSRWGAGVGGNITTFEPHRSLSNTDTYYAIVWAFCGGNTAY